MKKSKIIIIIILFMLILLYALPIPKLLDDVSFSQAIYDTNHNLLRLTLSSDEKYRLFTPLSKMPKHVIQATLLQEDKYFYDHFGVNPISLSKAIYTTYVLKNRKVGASTITMQLARIKFGINSKTLLGKLQQIIRATQLEMHYSKNQILEAYLNLAPYGRNIEGIGSASLIYFGRPIDKIILPEILTLAVIPQNPSHRIFTHDSYALKKARVALFQRWIEKFPEDNHLSPLMNLPIFSTNSLQLPFLAPHFVNWVINENPNDKEIVTTLDFKLQKIIEKITKNYITTKKIYGVKNADVMLINTQDMSVKAMIGSADFFDKTIGGQINGVLVNRSPGSTLKPFIYALALDQSLIHPATILKDVQSSFGDFNPENFDHDFMGPLSAKEALTLSRNIPAIDLANKLKDPNLYQFLQKTGLDNLKPEPFYGLTIVLGGAELSMEHLVSMYAMFANGGKWYSIRTKFNQPLLGGQQFLSPEASFLVLDMLKDTPRPQGFITTALDNRNVQLSWKTGTSSGYRDAWTIGVFKNYVLAVWVGNFDNTSNQAFIGKDIAAPLFFNLIESLSPLLEYSEKPQHLNITKVKVCKDSGMISNGNCPDLIDTWFIPGKSPIKKDTIYRSIPINKLTGFRTCIFNQNTVIKTYEFWPSDLLNLFEKAGIKRHTPPPYDKECSKIIQSNYGIAPKITSPQEGIKYIFRFGVNTNIIPFSATTDADANMLYWFINTGYAGESTQNKPFLWNAKPGSFVVRVIDDHGRSGSCNLKVEATN